jgi:hypothetical protein
VVNRAAHAWPLGEQPTRLRILRGESPLPSIARFGRLAYPTWRKVTTSTVLGRKSHGRHTTVCRIGGSDRGGQQIWRPEAKRMTAAPKLGTCREVAGQGEAERRPVPNVGKADVLWEETGTCTTRAAGVGVQASRERFAEITSGRSCGPAAGGPNGKDPATSRQASWRGGSRTGTSGRSSSDEKVTLL